MKTAFQFGFLRRGVYWILPFLYLFAFPAALQAAFTLYYTTNNETITITGNSGSPPAAVVIPNTISGYPVTSIGDYAFSYQPMASVSLPTGLTNIGSSAFEQCEYLTNIVIPNKVITIGENAFLNCWSLRGATIGSNVTSIGDSAFEACTNLAAFAVNASNPSFSSVGGVLFDKSAATLIQYPLAFPTNVYVLPNSVTDIKDSAFYFCSYLTDVFIDASLTNIESYAFGDCPALVDLYFAGNVPGTDGTELAYDDGNPNLTIYYQPETPGWSDTFDGVITLPWLQQGPYTYALSNNTVTITRYLGTAGMLTIPDTIAGLPVSAIGASAFYAPNNLTNVVIGNNVANIGDAAFDYCFRLTQATIPNGVVNIGIGAFANSGLVSVIIPASVTGLSGSVFTGCGNLTNAILESGVTTISPNMFYNCTSLASVVIPDSVTTIGDYAFEFSGLKSVNIPNSVVSLGSEAFSTCVNLITVCLGTNVNELDWESFGDCINLTGLYFEGNAPSMVDSTAFDLDSKAYIFYVPGTAGWDSFSYGPNTAPLYFTNLTVTIDTPMNGQRWSNSVFGLKGTTQGLWPVANVSFQVNSNGWQTATTTTLWSNWTASASLFPGTNLIQSVATNVIGVGSSNYSVSLDYVVDAPLRVQTAGLGTISPNDSNALLEVGRNYTVKASPASGFIFTNWSVLSNSTAVPVTNNASVWFMMASNLALQATYVETSRPALTITAPGAGQKMTNALASVTGTTGDKWKVSGVWYQLNYAAWNFASTSNNWTNWNASIPLAAGTNNISAYAVNLGGNDSITSSVSIYSSNAFMLQLSFATNRPLLTNGFTFALQLSTNLNGHLQYSTNLVNWITWTNFKGTNAQILFRDSAATNALRRFYRAVVP